MKVPYGKCLVITFITLLSCAPKQSHRVLLFYKNDGPAHGSTAAAVSAILKLGETHGFAVDTTQKNSAFTERQLKDYRAVIFLNNTGNILNGDQQTAFERYMQAGGGFVGIHAAAEAEPDWTWYHALVGATATDESIVQAATIVGRDSVPAPFSKIPKSWALSDGWYNFKNRSSSALTLATLDEESYDGGVEGDEHSIAWYQPYDGGRSFYTSLGHQAEIFADSIFINHVLGGIQYAIGDLTPLDFSKSYAVKTPEENRFLKEILSNDLNEPMELAVADNGFVYFIERSGNFYGFDPETKSTTILNRFKVMPDTKQGFGNGLLGMTLDPDFSSNHQIYFFYTPDIMPPRQRISRFTLTLDHTPDLKSEKILLEVPLELEVSAHTGGSLAWDKNRNLFISTGDNTVPFESEGFAPIDQRSGRITFDAQRSAGNTNDLRGKILRIHVDTSGIVSIPKGNLFDKGEPQTRPEIYAMGCRNPYRISVDGETSILYWGEIGPDSGEDGAQGPRGYDEFNQAKGPGFFGWPYFVGDNKPYHAFDFETKKIGKLFDPTDPVNNSPNNTGLQKLPSAQKAMIWYPYAKSVEFPLLGTGGRSAMAGPVYHYKKTGSSPNAVPDYYNNVLFGFEWMRNRVYAIRFDEKQNFSRLEFFMPVTGDFRRPIDMDISHDGIMYVLEYGSVYGVDNDDARLVKILFNSGNRAPVAVAIASANNGKLPLKVSFDSRSKDDDDDALSYEWSFNDGSQTSSSKSPTHMFTKAGEHFVTLRVRDVAGKQSADTVRIVAGNTMPEVQISTNDNQTFFFENTPFAYKANVTDTEEASIDSKKIKVTVSYVSRIIGAPAGHTLATFNPGKSLMESSDCKACHQLKKKSVGPPFMDVSRRYANDKSAAERLASKVLKGGGGVWGDHAMNAHPQLSKDEALTIVKYVLSLAVPEKKSLPAEASILFEKQYDNNGRYVVSASYTDAGSIPLTGVGEIVLRSSKVEAEDATRLRKIKKQTNQLGNIHDGSWFMLEQIDLKNIKHLTYRYSSSYAAAKIEVHVGGAHGPLISTLSYTSTGDWEKYNETTVPVSDPGGKNDLYFVFKKPEKPNQHICSVDWIEFKK